MYMSTPIAVASFRTTPWLFGHLYPFNAVDSSADFIDADVMLTYSPNVE